MRKSTHSASICLLIALNRGYRKHVGALFCSTWKKVQVQADMCWCAHSCACCIALRESNVSKHTNAPMCLRFLDSSITVWTYAQRESLAECASVWKKVCVLCERARDSTMRFMDVCFTMWTWPYLCVHTPWSHGCVSHELWRRARGFFSLIHRGRRDKRIGCQRLAYMWANESVRVWSWHYLDFFVSFLGFIISGLD